MLTPRPKTPAQALDLAFRRQKPARTQLAAFALAPHDLLAAINPKESEEPLQKPAVDFLAHPGVLGPGYYLNVSQRRDLAVRTGPKEADALGVIVEVKRAANAAEMVTPLDLNRKALHELLLYYLEDRRDGPRPAAPTPYPNETGRARGGPSPAACPIFDFPSGRLPFNFPSNRLHDGRGPTPHPTQSSLAVRAPIVSLGTPSPFRRGAGGVRRPLERPGAPTMKRR